jgi:hypothetical protein
VRVAVVFLSFLFSLYHGLFWRGLLQFSCIVCFLSLWVMLRCSLSCLCLGISWGRIIFAFFLWTWLPYILSVCIGVHDCRASYPYVAVVFILLTDWFFFLRPGCLLMFRIQEGVCKRCWTPVFFFFLSSI